MSKRKTKKQKKINQLKRQLKQAKFQSYQESIVKNTNKSKEVKKETKVDKKTNNSYQLNPAQIKNSKKEKKQEIFLYNPNLIKKDLKKTLILTLFFLLIIGAIYYLWELNGFFYLQSLL